MTRYSIVTDRLQKILMNNIADENKKIAKGVPEGYKGGISEYVKQ